MANLSIKKSHQQFALIILLIVVVAGVAFSVWYLSEKRKDEADQKNIVPVAAQRDSYNPANITAGD